MEVDAVVHRDNNDYGYAVRGPQSEYVVLVSRDGYDFVLKRKFIRPSIMLINMLGIPGGVEENAVNDANLVSIDSLILRRLCQYLIYKIKYTDPKDGVVPEFDIDVNVSLELLLASNFLDC